jgi:hypothetical protein
MIDWHHPRIYERFRCFGLCLFTLGVASHNVDNRPAALAAIVVTMLLLVRLKIELDIKRDEEEHSLERKIHRIQQINTMASVSMFVGLMALVRQMASGEITAPFLNWSTEVGTNTIAAVRQTTGNIVIQ